MPADPDPRRDRLVSAVHYLTAFALALEGVSHLEHRPAPILFVALCWCSSLAVIAVTAAHHRIEPHFPASQAVVHLAEASVASALAFLTHHFGKTGLPFAWALAALLLLARAAWEFFHHSRESHSSGPANEPSDSARRDA